MTPRKQLEALRSKMVAIAHRNGSMDPWWEDIADINDLLEGREGIVAEDDPGGD